MCFPVKANLLILLHSGLIMLTRPCGPVNKQLLLLNEDFSAIWECVKFHHYYFLVRFHMRIQVMHFDFNVPAKLRIQLLVVLLVLLLT